MLVVLPPYLCALLSPATLQEKELPKEKDATLWDCEELALRYVLEDGKLNLYVHGHFRATWCCRLWS